MDHERVADLLARELIRAQRAHIRAIERIADKYAAEAEASGHSFNREAFLRRVGLWPPKRPRIVHHPLVAR